MTDPRSLMLRNLAPFTQLSSIIASFKPSRNRTLPVMRLRHIPFLLRLRQDIPYLVLSTVLQRQRDPSARQAMPCRHRQQVSIFPVQRHPLLTAATSRRARPASRGPAASSAYPLGLRMLNLRHRVRACQARRSLLSPPLLRGNQRTPRLMVKPNQRNGG
jgi:hypothetical protein